MPLCRNTLDATLNEIAGQAERAEKEWSTREWTRRVKNALIQLGTEGGYTPCPNPQYGWGEFLYDVTWLQTAGENFRVSDVLLVAEIEWGNRGDVWDDFQKLLVARADVRVMIFEGYKGLLEKLRAHTIQFAKNGNGDRYLLAQYLAAERRFAVEAWCLRVPPL